MSIQVYHGSRHPIQTFSTEYADTGEGNQAYGWGLYFADSPKVAEFYANSGGDADSPRYVYEVELSVNPDDLLSFEDPVNRQGEAVRRSIHQAMKEFRWTGVVDLAMSGEKFYNYISTAPEIYEKPIDVRYKFASLWLLDHGVPGIRYLDGNSRFQGGGATYDYVIFDDDLVINYSPVPDSDGQGRLFAQYVPLSVLEDSRPHVICY